MHRRLIGALAVGIVTAIVATGCASGGGSSSGKTELTFWTIESSKVYDDIIADFEKENPDITVKKTVSPTNQNIPNLQVAATNKSLPDVFFEGLGAPLAHEFIDNGLIMNLDDHAKEQGWDTRFSPLSVEYLKWKDGWWEAPHAALGMGLFYNKKIFADLGIAEPTTFTELEAAVKKIKDAGIVPFSLGGKGGWMTMRFTDALIENFGGPEVHDSLYDAKADWTQPAVQTALTTLQDWNTKGYFTPGFLSVDPTTDYVSLFAGEAAMVLEGPWFDATIINQDQKVEDYGLFPFPTDAAPDDARIPSWASGFMIPENSKHKEEALKFLDYLVSDEVLTKYADTIDGPVANANVPGASTQPNANKIKELLGDRGGYHPSDQMFPEEALNTFFSAQDSLIAGTMTPKEAADAIQTSLKNG